MRKSGTQHPITRSLQQRHPRPLPFFSSKHTPVPPPPTPTPHLQSTLHLIRHGSHSRIVMNLRQRTLRTRPKHPAPPAPRQIRHVLRHALEILPHELTRRLREEDVDFLEGFVLRLGHERELVEPADDGDAAVKAERKADARHGGLHVGEEVRDEPGAEEEGDVRGLHAVGAEIGGVDLGGQDPGEAGVGAEEALVEDEAGDVAALGAADVGLAVDEVGAADDEEAEEEAGQHGAGPEAPAEALHVEDGGDGAEEEGAAADEGHEDGLLAVEADLVHERRHVVHDCLDDFGVSDFSLTE